MCWMELATIFIHRRPMNQFFRFHNCTILIITFSSSLKNTSKRPRAAHWFHKEPLHTCTTSQHQCDAVLCLSILMACWADVYLPVCACCTGWRIFCTASVDRQTHCNSVCQLALILVWCLSNASLSSGWISYVKCVHCPVVHSLFHSSWSLSWSSPFFLSFSSLPTSFHWE